MNQRTIIIAISLAVGIVFSMATLSFVSEPAAAKPSVTRPLLADNSDLTRLFEQDRTEHGPVGSTDPDKGRDAKRAGQAREIIADGTMHSGPDYYHAAQLVLRGGTSADYLSAHEMAVAALALGQVDARWVAAASEDMYLVSIGQPQRFGTQAKQSNGGGALDGVRLSLGVPPLDPNRTKKDRRSGIPLNEKPLALLQKAVE